MTTVEPEPEPVVCAWCERPIEGEHIGFWEPEEDDGTAGFYCSAECLLSAL